MYRRLLVLSLVLAGLLVTAATGVSLSPSLAFQSSETYQGILMITWADNLEEERPPLTYYRLLTDSGETLLLLPGEVSEAELWPLYMQQVVVSGEMAEESLSSEDGRITPTLILNSIAPAAARNAASASFPAPSRLITGNKQWVTLLCKYADYALEPRSLSFYQQIYSSDYPGLDHYWREASYDRMNLANSDTFGWYVLPKPLDEYHENLWLATEDCMKAADADVYFPDYFGILFIFNRQFDNYPGWGGSLSSPLDGNVFRIYRFALLEGSDWWGMNHVQTVMAYAHGLPYSYTGSYAYGNPWDVTSDSVYGCNDSENKHPLYGCIGQHVMTFSRYDLGWIEPERLYVAGPGKHSLTLEQATLPGPDGYLLAVIPIKGSTTHFYTLEARRKVGYDNKLPGDALIIHEIGGPDHPRVLVDPGQFRYGAKPSAMWLPGEAFASAESDILVQVTGATATGFEVTIINGGNQKQSKSISPAADTFVRIDKPDENFGQRTVLRVSNDPKIWTLLKFDDTLVPPGTYHMQLRMRVVSGDAESQGNLTTLAADTSCWPGASWQEETLTWNDFSPTLCPNFSSDGLGRPVRKEDWVYWDLTVLGPRYGLQKLRIVQSWGPMSYSSREGADPPEVLIDYLIPPGAPMVTVTTTPKASSTATPSPTQTPKPTKTVSPTPEQTSTPTITATATAAPGATATHTSEPGERPSPEPEITRRVTELPEVVWMPFVVTGQ